MSWVQLTAYMVLDRVQWTLASGDATDTARRWTVIAQGLEQLPDGREHVDDVAWVALLAALRDLEARSPSAGP